MSLYGLFYLGFAVLGGFLGAVLATVGHENRFVICLVALESAILFGFIGLLVAFIILTVEAEMFYWLIALVIAIALGYLAGNWLNRIREKGGE